MFSLDSYSTTVINTVADPGSTPQAGDVSSIIPADRIRLKRLRPGNNVVLEDMGDAIRIGAHSVSNPEVLMDPADLDILGDDGHTIKRLRAGNHITLTSEPDHIQIDSVGGVAGTGVSSAGAPGGVSLIKQESVIKDLKAGTNVTLDTTDENCVTINANDVDIFPSLTNAGSGLSWVDDGALHKIRGIQNLGPHLQVTLSEDGKDIQLQDTFVPYTPTVLTSTGGSHTLANATIPLGLKGLSAGTNISITPTDTDVTINNTYSFTETPLTTSGTGTSLRKSDHVLKDLKAGSLITLSTTEDDVTIQGVAPPALTSTGTGNTSLVGSTTQSLKSLQAGTNINLVTDGDTVTLHNTYSYTPPAPTVLTNAGTNGTSLVGSAAQSIKSLVPGSNVTLTTNGDEVTVAAATQTFTETPITTSGTGTSILQSGHVLKDLKAGSNITITSTTNDVTIAADTQTFTETPTTSAGATDGSSLINANHVIKDLKAGTNITLDTTDAKCITINSVDITTTGTGTSILKAGYVMKDLIAGTNVSLTNTVNDVTISVSALPTPLFNFDLNFLAQYTTWSGGPPTSEPRGNTGFSTYMWICEQTRCLVPNFQFVNDTLNTRVSGVPLSINPNRGKQAMVCNVNPCHLQINHANASFSFTLDPWVATGWMVLVLGIDSQATTGTTHVFHKTNGTGPRISLTIPSSAATPSALRWRVSVCNTGYTGDTAYWDVTTDGSLNGTLVSLTATNLNYETRSFIVACRYTDTYCSILVPGLNTPVDSPLFSTWTTSGAPVNSLTLTAKTTLWKDASTGLNTWNVTKNGIAGTNWYLFSHPSDPAKLQQIYQIYAARFYADMDNVTLAKVVTYMKTEFWTNLS